MIRVQGVYRSGFELSVLRGSGCNELKEDGQTWVAWDELYKSCTSKEVDGSLDNLLRPPNPENMMERRSAGVVFLGYFEVSPTYKLVNDYPQNGFGHMGEFKNQFTVKCLEQAEAPPVK